MPGGVDPTESERLCTSCPGRRCRRLHQYSVSATHRLADVTAPLAYDDYCAVDTGIFGLAVGFASQSLLKDVINGLFILFQDSLDVGDVVMLRGTGGQ